jgi:membrane associated rhomboid family serine protease
MAYNRGSILNDSPVVKNLIIFNVIVFAAQNIITNINLDDLGVMYYYKNEAFKPYQIVTSMFMHGSIGHLFFNMFTLFVFGSTLERFWGSKRLLFFYLVCGLGAGVFQQIVGNFYAVLGASGAIMGLMAAFAYLFPNTEMMMMFIPFPIKAKYLIPIFVLMDLYGGFARQTTSNVVHFAHLGGALVGFLLVLYWNKTNKKTFY